MQQRKDRARTWKARRRREAGGVALHRALVGRDEGPLLVNASLRDYRPQQLRTRPTMSTASITHEEYV